MALCSHILAMGELSDQVMDCLEQDKYRYLDLPRGIFVFNKIFQCLNTTMSVRMAKAFRVDPEDPSTYQINPRRVRVERLHDAFVKRKPIEFTDDWYVFQKLRDNGFLFFFRPEP